MARRDRINKRLLKEEKKMQAKKNEREASAIARKARLAKREYKYLRAKEKAERNKHYAKNMDYAYELEAVEREIKALVMMNKTTKLSRHYKKNAKREMLELRKKRKDIARRQRNGFMRKRRPSLFMRLLPTLLLVALLVAAYFVFQ